MIKLQKVLEEMEQKYTNGKAKPFRMVFVKANKRTGVAGEVVELDSATCSFVDNVKRTCKISSYRQEFPITVHYDLILSFNNTDIA